MSNAVIGSGVPGLAAFMGPGSIGIALYVLIRILPGMVDAKKPDPAAFRESDA